MNSALSLQVWSGVSAMALVLCACGEPTSALPGSDGGRLVDAALSNPDAELTDSGGLPSRDAGRLGCGRAGVPTGLSSVDTTAAGVARRYQVFVPTSYDSAAPTSLVFVFHGLGGDGDQIRSYLSIEANAGGQALFVYPDGVATAATGGRAAWSVGDLELFDVMVAEMSAAYCVDPDRIFAMGHSFGAYMTNLVGCQRSDVVRGIAAVSGGTVGGVCRGPVAAWLAHGTMDPTVPDSEGIAARAQWLMTNGCSSTSTPTDPSPCVTYDGCAAGAPMTWCSFDGGHYPLPAFTQGAIWDFFRAL